MPEPLSPTAIPRRSAPEWKRTFELGELPEDYRARLQLLAEFVEPEHGPGPYARSLEQVTDSFLEFLNHPPNATAARDAAAVAPSGSLEEKTRRVIRVRLERAWTHLWGPYKETLSKWADAEDRERATQRADGNPWTGREGWAEEAALPIHMLSRRRQGEDVEEAEEPGYLIYNQLVLNEHYRPFRTSGGDPRIAVPGAYGLEVFDPLSQQRDLSRDLLRKIGYSLFTVKGRAVPVRELAVAVGALVGRAASRELPRERVVELAVRVAPRLPAGSLLDLMDARHRCIALDSDGWRIETVGHPVFDSRRHMLALPEPSPSDPSTAWERVSELWRFANLAPGNGPENASLLAAALLVQFLLFPSSPKPVTIITGDEGSGKTSAATRLGSILDPSLVPIVRPPGDDDALLNLAMNHAVINIDNVSFISHEMSDDLARLSTGIGLPKRRLFTDSDEILTNAKPLVILNGITATPSAADLLRRAIFLPVVQPSPMKSQAELDAEWRAAHPRILSGLLDLSSATARVLASGKQLLASSSMADYVRVGQAVAVAIGRDTSDFIAAWEANVERQGVAAAENPWVTTLYDYFNGQPVEGESKRADSIANYINEFDRVTFPRGVTSQAVGNAIARVKKTLARMGIHIARRTAHGIAVYVRVAEAEGQATRPIEGYGPSGPAVDEGGPAPQQEGLGIEKGSTRSTQSDFSLETLQDGRHDGMSLQLPGVDLGGTPLLGPPNSGWTSRGGSPLGPPLGPPNHFSPTGDVQGGPGGPNSGKRGETPSNSTTAGPDYPKQSSATLEWASAGCEGCPACAPPHANPIDCTCSRCDPFGHSAYASAGRAHFCGQVERRRPA